MRRASGHVFIDSSSSLVLWQQIDKKQRFYRHLLALLYSGTHWGLCSFYQDVFNWQTEAGVKKPERLSCHKTQHNINTKYKRYLTLMFVPHPHRGAVRFCRRTSKGRKQNFAQALCWWVWCDPKGTAGNAQESRPTLCCWRLHSPRAASLGWWLQDVLLT